eukprot:jgi/Psemu1/53796/gm1.53796_g
MVWAPLQLAPLQLGNRDDQLYNPTRDPRFSDPSNPISARIKNKSNTMRSVISSMKGKGKPPIKCPDGRECCHSWHIRGNCFTGCKHLYDHSATTSEEQDRLWDAIDSAPSPPFSLDLPRGPLPTPPLSAFTLPSSSPRGPPLTTNVPSTPHLPQPTTPHPFSFPAIPTPTTSPQPFSVPVIAPLAQSSPRLPPCPPRRSPRPHPFPFPLPHNLGEPSARVDPIVPRPLYEPVSVPSHPSTMLSSPPSPALAPPPSNVLASSPSTALASPPSDALASPPGNMLASSPSTALASPPGAVRGLPSNVLARTWLASPPAPVWPLPAPLRPPCLVTTGNAPLVTPFSYPIDRLDVHINRVINVYNNSTSWGDIIRTIRGQGDIHPDVGNIPHPACHLLDHFGKEGTPASMTGPPWDSARISGALARGPHQSSHQGIAFLQEEYADMMDKQQWTVLPAGLIQDLPNLRLSPLGLVPQQGRRPRMISDYTYSEVNQDTTPLVPTEAMQFGHTLPRLLTKLHRANNRFGPVYMSKIDLADGFYRVQLKPEDTMKLGVHFPSRKGEPSLIGIPLTNPMGWKSSPPNFCAFTETIAGLANATSIRTHMNTHESDTE